jgi:hypothetical protein
MKPFKTFFENKGPCWPGYVQVGTKMKNGKKVPNCVPKESVQEGKEEYIMKKGSFTRKVDGKTADKMKRQGWKLVAKENVQEGPGKNKGETWEKGFKRRVVKTTKPEHKEDGYNWRIKGKERDDISIKLYKNKPSYDEYTKQMKRVAGHEFGG